jgi:hypothetical protein
MKTLFRSLVAVVLVFCGSLAKSQEIDVNELPRPEFRGLNQKEMSRLVFSNEQAMITSLSRLHLVTEAYVQSLGHHQTLGMDRTLDEKSDSVIDDWYFLARADFNREPPVEELLVGGGAWRNRVVETNAGALEEVHPNGMVAMLFVDFESFDSDTYSLMYAGSEPLANTECLVFNVVPVNERQSGRFHGQIWVDSSNFGIVRIKGVFVGPYKSWKKMLKGPDRFFHFDSWREKIDNRWVPSSTYFDERHAFHTDGNLEFRYRGYASLWQQHQPEGEPLLNKTSYATGNGAILDGPSPSFSQNALVARLESDGLLAVRGQEEQRLDQIVQQIRPASEVGSHKVGCRVLVTTPAEIFAVGDTIIVSRGLLNLVPNDSVLALLLARQVAHIVLGHTGSVARSFPKSLFDVERKKDFVGLGIHWSPEEESAADSEAIALLKDSPYKSAVESASAFLLQLRSESHRFPNLLRARFGVGLMPDGSSMASKEHSEAIASGENSRLEDRYRVSWNQVITDSEGEGTEAKVTTLKKPLADQISVAK